MKHMISLAALAAASLAVASPAAAQGGRYAQEEESRFDAAQSRFEAELNAYQAAFDRYREWRARNPNRGGPPPGPPPRGPGYNDSRYDNDYDDPDYDAARFYRQGPTYQERVLAQDERVYRGNDGRYYCRRSDGTTGLIVGAATGGLLGNIIAGRRSSTVGTILGAIAGGAAGASIDRNQVRCR
jgi:hypothetical protein